MVENVEGRVVDEALMDYVMVERRMVVGNVMVVGNWRMSVL